MKKLSAYWKCQLIGWGLYELANFFFMHARRDTANINFLFALFVLISGYVLNILIAHTLYLVIKKLAILSKRIIVQVTFLVGLTLFFSVLKIYTWVSLFSFLVPAEHLKNNADSNIASFYFMMGFFITSTLFIWNLIFFGYHFTQTMIKEKQQKIIKEKKLWEMEARMLRTQMNPYFVFESTQSLREFMMQKQKKLAIHYLTTFSKLMRILLQNSDKPFVSLVTELETCQHYTELEEIRMDNKLRSEFTVDPTIDQHSIKIPALSIQPFIEKAIYYRIRPAGEGVLSVTVANEGDKIVCDVHDSAVNRKAYLLEIKEEKPDIKKLNLTQREGITETRWFKENTSVEVFETPNETENLPGTTVQLTFKAYNDDKDSID